MLTNAQIKTLLIDNLDSTITYGTQLELTQLIKRPNAQVGNEYRIYDTKTSSLVTDLTDFISKLDTDSLKMDVYRQAYRIESGFIKPFTVTINNFNVKLIETNSNDADFINLCGFGMKKICFIIGYTSDADTVLPLKILDFKLV